MLPSIQRAAGAAGLIVFALSGFAHAGDAIPAAPIGDHVQVVEIPAPAGSHEMKPAWETAEPTASSFVHKNKLFCADGSAGTPGSILFGNDGPGTLTVGMTIKVVIQPTGKVISYVLPYDLPPHTGVIWYDAFRAGTMDVSCTFAATPHPGERGKHV